MIKISGTIITFNEEKNIERCIESMLPVCDEIVVLDSLSIDKTEEICKRHNVTFISQPFLGHIEQKNKAIEHTSFDYILSLDADEALDHKLQEQILEFKKKPEEMTALKFNRLTRYVDKWIRNCNWYPDVKLRVWNKNHGRWAGSNPHDFVEVLPNIKIKHLEGDLLHYSYESISSHIAQTNKFTTIAAKVAYEEGATSSTFKIVSRPIFTFLKDYFLRRGFLDGRYGLIICSINALYSLLKYSKIKELQEKKFID